MPALRLRDLTLRPFAVDSGSAKFDIALFAMDAEHEIALSWNYNTDLFEAATIERMARHFETLLGSILAEPDARLSALEFRTQAEREREAAEASLRRESKFKKFLSVAPKAVSLTEVALVGTEEAWGGEGGPLVVRPEGEVDVAAWVEGNRRWIQGKLDAHGAVLLRGFGLRGSRPSSAWPRACAGSSTATTGTCRARPWAGRSTAQRPTRPSSRFCSTTRARTWGAGR